jgi:hypothetical protein
MKYTTIIFCALLFISCASRKVDLNIIETKKDSLVEKTVVIKDSISEKKETKINYKIFTDINEINIKPIDTSKAIEINGIKYKNAILSLKNTKVNTLYSKDKIESKNESKLTTKKDKIHLITKENIKVKKVYKKFNYFVFLWLFLIPVFYFIYKRFRI